MDFVMGQIKVSDGKMDELTSLDFYSVKTNVPLTVTLTIIILLIVFVVFIILINLFEPVDPNANCTTAPLPPTNISAQTVDENTFTISWTESDQTTSYVAYVGLNPSFTRPQALQLETTTSSSATVVGLDLDTTYYIFVTSINPCGESSNSATSTFDHLL